MRYFLQEKRRMGGARRGCRARSGCVSTTENATEWFFTGEEENGRSEEM
jgi:hypothetical protein